LNYSWVYNEKKLPGALFYGKCGGFKYYEVNLLFLFPIVSMIKVFYELYNIEL